MGNDWIDALCELAFPVVIGLLCAAIGGMMVELAQMALRG